MGFFLLNGPQRPGCCTQGEQSRARCREGSTPQKTMWQHNEGSGKYKLKKNTCVGIWLLDSKNNNFQYLVLQVFYTRIPSQYSKAFDKVFWQVSDVLGQMTVGSLSALGMRRYEASIAVEKLVTRWPDHLQNQHRLAENVSFPLGITWRGSSKLLNFQLSFRIPAWTLMIFKHQREG